MEQGEGDSVVGAFSVASAAVAAALDAQRAFALEPWPEGGEVRVVGGVLAVLLASDVLRSRSVSRV